MNHKIPQTETISLNPATGGEIGRVPLNTPEETIEFIRHGHTAQLDWRNTPVQERGRCLKKVMRYLMDHMDALALTIARDNGKNRTDALVTEIVPAVLALNYYIKNSRRFLKDVPLSPGSLITCYKKSRIVRVPYGVIGIVSPWNYPFAIPFSEVVMALLAGNAVVLKTATETQQVGTALKAAIEAANLPNGLFSFVNMPGQAAGNAFLNGGVDKLFFTGSVPVGKRLMAQAAETLTPVCLELGGNDPMIVCADADPVRAAAGAVWAGFQNAGQSCGGIERIYVHEDVSKPFLSELAKRTEELKIGHPEDLSTDFGVMTSQKQLDTVQEHVEDAVAEGARILAQSEKSGSLQNFYPATVLTDVNHRMKVMQEETFGPVLAVAAVGDMDEAVRLANDSNLGLTASVWTRNRRQADRLALRLRAGAVTVNDHLMSHGLPETSWGGFRESGIGRTHGKLGFDEMTKTQVIVHDFLPGICRDLWWHPYSADLYKGLKGIPELLHGHGLRDRFKGGLNLMRIAGRMWRAM